MSLHICHESPTMCVCVGEGGDACVENVFILLPIFLDKIGSQTLKLVLVGTQRNLCCINKSSMKHQQKPNSNYKILLIELCLSEVRDYWFLHWTHRFSRLFTLQSVEYLIKFENIVHYLSKTCLYVVCSLILVKSHTNQNIGVQ